MSAKGFGLPLQTPLLGPSLPERPSDCKARRRMIVMHVANTAWQQQAAAGAAKARLLVIFVVFQEQCYHLNEIYN